MTDGQAAAWALAGAAVLAEVPYPLLEGPARDRLTALAVVVFFMAVVTHATTWYGVARAVLMLLVTAGGGLLVEAVGVRTGRPFGRYAYGRRLGPAVAGVPAVVPMAWTMAAYPALAAARAVTRTRGRQVLLAAAGLAGWDLFLDPQMVAAGHWHWERVGAALPGVPEVPLTNYAGWLAVALAMAVALSAALPERDTDDGPLHALFLWTYGSSVLANLAFFRRPAVAAWGGLGMGVLALPLARRLRR